MGHNLDVHFQYQKCFNRNPLLPLLLPPHPLLPPPPPTSSTPLSSFTSQSSTTPPKKKKISELNVKERNIIIRKAEELLKPLKNSCFRKTEGWWIYEVCTNEKVRQLHTERQSDPKHESSHLEIEVNSYILGKYDSGISNDPPPSANQPGFKKKKKSRHQNHPPGYNLDISDKRPLSLKQTFQWGTPCDLTNKPRETMLDWSCGAKQKATFIEEVQEIATCKYLVKMKTPLLCKINDFVDHESHDLNEQSKVETIHCHPLISQSSDSGIFHKGPSPTTPSTSPPSTVITSADGATGLLNRVTQMLSNQEGASGMMDSELLQSLLDSQSADGNAANVQQIKIDLTGQTGDGNMNEMTQEEILAAVRNVLGDNVQTVVLDTNDEESQEGDQ